MKQKFPYNIKKSLTRVLPLGALMALAYACHKDPIPTPTPEPEPTPAYPPIDTTIARDTIVVDWNADANLGWAPPPDRIKRYTDIPTVRVVLINTYGRDGPNTPADGSGLTPYAWHYIREQDFEPCFDVHPEKVRARGDFYICSRPGADSMPNHDINQEQAGIAWYDKIWLEQHGFTLRPKNR